MNNAPPSVDMDTLNTLRDIMGSKFGLLIETYLGEANTLLEEIEAAITESDSTKLCQAAHSLKSSSANLGGMGLSDIAKQLEQLGRGGEVTKTGDLYFQAKTEFARVKTVLQAA